VDEYYVLYQCGSPKPDASAPGVAGLTSPRYFQIPLYKTAVMDSNAAAFMVELDVVDRVESAQVYSVNSCLQKVAESALSGCPHLLAAASARHGCSISMPASPGGRVRTACLSNLPHHPHSYSLILQPATMSRVPATRPGWPSTTLSSAPGAER
jgi:hypothetical protein